MAKHRKSEGGHSLHVLKATQGGGPGLMGVSHTASKRVLQVQTAVNPESCCLWFAFSPQHFALQTQQLC